MKPTVLLTQNRKLKKTSDLIGFKVLNFGITAFKTSTGKVTCPMASGCEKYCYAQKGAFWWKKVKDAYERRYVATQEPNFVDKVNAEILKKKPKYVRVHDSGDYYSKKYLDKWLAIAIHNPDVRFYSYTLMVDMFKKTKLPANFDVIFSTAGKQDHLINKKVDRHSEIFIDAEKLRSKGYSTAAVNDLHATKWFTENNKIGLIYH